MTVPEEIGPEELEAGVQQKRLIGAVLILLDNVWKWAGARDGLQEMEEYGAGFEGWYWRSSITCI